MSKILSSEDYGLKLYNRFPPKYREDDVGQNLALKRYMQTASDGGFKYSIDEINGIIDLLDPNKTPAEVLPVLFRQFGLEVFNGIPEAYLRYLLPRMGELWESKGSMSAIEFMTSSLTGIKTSTEITYDEHDNPLITVRLEMDYNLGDFFPDPEQLTCLIEDFIPFYCDPFLIYSYVFFENQVLGTHEKHTMTIHDLKNEHGLIPYQKDPRLMPVTNIEIKTLNGSVVLNDVFGCNYEPDWYRDRITYHFKENGEIDSVHSNDYYKQALNDSLFVLNNTLITNERELTDYFRDKISLAIIKDELSVNAKDTLQNRVHTGYNDSASIWSRGKDIPTNAVFGTAMFGDSVFGGSEDYADVFRDVITNHLVSSGNIGNPVDTFTNVQYNMLNGSFFTNSMFSWDTITTRGALNSTLILNESWLNECTREVSVLF